MAIQLYWVQISSHYLSEILPKCHRFQEKEYKLCSEKQVKGDAFQVGEGRYAPFYVESATTGVRVCLTLQVFNFTPVCIHVPVIISTYILVMKDI